jgi:hypothetical protein
VKQKVTKAEAPTCTPLLFKVSLSPPSCVRAAEARVTTVPEIANGMEGIPLMISTSETSSWDVMI